MAYVVPTAANVKARFPAFSSVDDAAITTAIDEAKQYVDESWSEEAYTLALMLYAAHVLTGDNLGSGTEAQLAGFRRLRIGSLELESSAPAASELRQWMRTTSYGRRWLSLLKKEHPGVLTV